MTAEYHCGNCSNLGCSINPAHIDYEGFRLISDSPATFAQREQVRLRGCLSHPSAQAALRAEGAERVVKEIKLYCTKQIKWWDESGTRIMHEGAISALGNVIKRSESLRQSQSTGGEQR